MPRLADSICDVSDDEPAVVDRVEVWIGIVSGILGIGAIALGAVRFINRRRRAREEMDL